MDTITIAHDAQYCGDAMLDRTEHYTCKLAAMRRMLQLMDAGEAFAVEFHPHAVDHAPALRRVTLWDEMRLLDTN